MRGFVGYKLQASSSRNCLGAALSAGLASAVSFLDAVSMGCSDSKCSVPGRAGVHVDPG